jgi:hypothetical protein
MTRPETILAVVLNSPRNNPKHEPNVEREKFKTLETKKQLLSPFSCLNLWKQVKSVTKPAGANKRNTPTPVQATIIARQRRSAPKNRSLAILSALSSAGYSCKHAAYRPARTFSPAFGAARKHPVSFRIAETPFLQAFGESVLAAPQRILSGQAGSSYFDACPCLSR